MGREPDYRESEQEIERGEEEGMKMEGEKMECNGEFL